MKDKEKKSRKNNTNYRIIKSNANSATLNNYSQCKFQSKAPDMKNQQKNDIIIEAKDKDFFLDDNSNLINIQLTAYQRFKENNSATKPESFPKNKSKNSDYILLNINGKKDDKVYDNSFTSKQIHNIPKTAYSRNLSMISSLSWNQKTTSTVKNIPPLPVNVIKIVQKEGCNSSRQHEHSKTRRSFNKLLKQSQPQTKRNPQSNKYKKSTVDKRFQQVKNSTNDEKNLDVSIYSYEPMNKKQFQYFTITDIMLQEQNENKYERKTKKKTTNTLQTKQKMMTRFKLSENPSLINIATNRTNEFHSSNNKQPVEDSQGKRCKINFHINNKEMFSYLQKKFPNCQRKKNSLKSYHYSNKCAHKYIQEPKLQYKNTLTRKELGIESFFDIICNSNDSSTNRTSYIEKHTIKSNKSISKDNCYNFNKNIRERTQPKENEKTQLRFNDTDNSNDLYKYKRDHSCDMHISLSERMLEIKQIVSKFGLLIPSRQHFLSSIQKK